MVEEMKLRAESKSWTRQFAFLNTSLLITKMITKYAKKKKKKKSFDGIFETRSECSKLAQKQYKTKHNWVDKVIHLELCKKFKFDHTNKWYMHNPASVLENETQTPMGFWHTNGSSNLGQTTRPYNNQKNLQNCGLCCPGWTKSKIESEKDKYLDLARELKKTAEHERDIYTNCNWGSWYNHRRINKGIERFGNKRTSGD